MHTLTPGDRSARDGGLDPRDYRCGRFGWSQRQMEWGFTETQTFFHSETHAKKPNAPPSPRRFEVGVAFVPHLVWASSTSAEDLWRGGCS